MKSLCNASANRATRAIVAARSAIRAATTITCRQLANSARFDSAPNANCDCRNNNCTIPNGEGRQQQQVDRSSSPLLLLLLCLHGWRCRNRRRPNERTLAKEHSVARGAPPTQASPSGHLLPRCLHIAKQQTVGAAQQAGPAGQIGGSSWLANNEKPRTTRD